MTLDEIKGAVARGWCHPKNAAKEMDADLALAIAEEVHRAELQGGALLGLATTAELLGELTARAEVAGYAKYRTVDGEYDPNRLYGHEAGADGRTF